MRGNSTARKSATARRIALSLALMLSLIVAESSGPPAAAQSGSRQLVDVRFTQQRPGVPTGLSFNVDYVNPGDPSAKPSAVRTVDEIFPEGAHYDTSVPAQCTASDAQLIAQGESACPPASKVGRGYIRIDTGFPEPNRFFEVDVAFFNNAGQLIFLNTERASGLRVVSRASIQGGRLISSAPPLPGTPPDGGALDIVQTELFEVSRQADGKTRGYITTPPFCPPDGWVISLSFTYADGITQSVPSTSPCIKGSDGGADSAQGRCVNRWQGEGGPDHHGGTAAGDHLSGKGGADRLRGRPGRDCLRGGRGDDVLRGGRAADRLVGGPGQDTCHGGRGKDQLTGCERVVTD